jgi:hypothetical protein
LGALVDAPAVYRVLVWNVDRADAKPHTSVGLGDAVGINGVGVVELGRGLRGGEAGKGSDAEDDGGVHGGGWGWTVECRGSDVGEAVYVWVSCNVPRLWSGMHSPREGPREEESESITRWRQIGRSATDWSDRWAIEQILHGQRAWEQTGGAGKIRSGFKGYILLGELTRRAVVEHP